MMPSIKLKSIDISQEQFNRSAKVVINVHADIDRSNGLEQDLTLTRNQQGKWIATIALDDFPEKETPEEAVERLQLWLKTLAKGLSHRQVKKLNLTTILNSINFK